MTKEFEFEALPGKTAPAPAAPVERPKRGPKKGSKRARKVAVPTVADSILCADRPSRLGHARGSAELSVEYDLIRQLMGMNDATRKRVLLILNKVFG